MEKRYFQLELPLCRWENDFSDWDCVCADGKMIFPIGIVSVPIGKTIFPIGIVSVQTGKIDRRRILL
jgi:hypothetical protein